MLRSLEKFEKLSIWEQLGDRLPWYFVVSTNRMPAKYLICRRIPCEVDLNTSSEEVLWSEHERLTTIFLDTWKAIRSRETELSELPKVKPSLMDLNVELVKRMLTHCNFCRWNCRVDRSMGTKHGTCQLESTSRVGSYFHHRGEELVFRGNSGSGTIFFTSCNLRCQFCFHPDTMVLTDRGLKRIETVFASGDSQTEFEDGLIRFVSGSKTYTREGRLERISKVFSHDYRGEMVVIRPFHCPTLILTPNHQVFATTDSTSGNIEKVRAEQLTQKHYLVVPKLMPQSLKPVIDTFQLLEPYITRFVKTKRKVAVEELISLVITSPDGISSTEIAQSFEYHPAYVRKLLPMIGRGEMQPDDGCSVNNLVVEKERVRFKTEKRPGIPRRLELDEDLAELLGYYCSEGHVSKDSRRPNSYTLVFSFGRHEARLAERTAELLSAVFSVDPPIVRRRRTTLRVEIGKASLALLFKSLCGESSDSKQVPWILTMADKEVIRAFLEGYIKGDGSDLGDQYECGTVSERLALGLFALFLHLGVLPSFNVRQPEPKKVIEGREVNQSTLYYVKVRKNKFSLTKESNIPEARTRYEDRGGYFLVPIYKIKREHYAGPVYNLEINDKDHSYLANFVAVGNCQNGDISHDKENGIPVTPRLLAFMAWQLRMEGCHNINWVGGEPTIHLHNIIEAISLLDFRKPSMRELSYILQAKADAYHSFRMNTETAYYEGEFNAPMLWNSNFFMSPETMKILRVLIDVWLPDFKFGSDKCAVFLSKTPWYFETVAANHKLVHNWGEDMVIRHLIMPNHLNCCTRPVLKWIAENMPTVPVNVMDQYHPDYACNPCSNQYDERYEELSREPLAQEIIDAYQYAKDLGLLFQPLSYEKNMTGIQI